VITCSDSVFPRDKLCPSAVSRPLTGLLFVDCFKNLYSITCVLFRHFVLKRNIFF
jgi:hypothetical protein